MNNLEVKFENVNKDQPNHGFFGNGSKNEMQDDLSDPTGQHVLKKSRTTHLSQPLANMYANNKESFPSRNKRNGSGATEDDEESSSVTQHPRQRRPRSSRAPTKRPLSAYNIFFSEERARLRSDPSAAHLTFGQFGKIVAERWDKLPENEKVELQTRAEQSRQAYFKQVMSQSPVYGSSTLLPGSSKGEKVIEIGVVRAAAKLLRTHANSIHRPENRDPTAMQQNVIHGHWWKEVSGGNDPPPLQHGGRLPGHLYSPQVEALLARLGGSGSRGGAGPSDTEVPAVDVLDALDASSAALEDTARMTMHMRVHGAPPQRR